MNLRKELYKILKEYKQDNNAKLYIERISKIIENPLAGYYYLLVEEDDAYNFGSEFWIYDDKFSDYVINDYLKFEEIIRDYGIQDIYFPQEAMMEVTTDNPEEYLISLGMKKKI